MLSEIMGSPKPIDLVEEFKGYLRDAGVAIKEFHQGKYFAATKRGATTFLLAHESTAMDGGEYQKNTSRRWKVNQKRLGFLIGEQS